AALPSLGGALPLSSGELSRNAGAAHPFIDASPPRQVDRVIAARAGAEAADREARLHDQSRLCSGARLLDPPEVRQRRGERQMREREIAVDIDGTAKPRDRFLILPEMQLGGAGAAHPVMCCDIAGAEAQRLEIGALRLLGPPERGLRQTDQRMGVD